MRTLAACAVVFVLAVPWAGRAADPANEEGKRAFAAGVNLLQDPDGARYEDALPQFRRAYELTGSWKVLGNIGICSLKLERDGEAIAAFEKYLTSGGKEIDRAERAQVERDLATLKAAVVTVHLSFPEPGVKVEDDRVNNRGQHVVNSYAATSAALDIGLHAGHHTLTARSKQNQERWEVELETGRPAQHAFFVGKTSDGAPVVTEPPAAASGLSTPPPGPSSLAANAQPSANGAASGATGRPGESSLAVAGAKGASGEPSRPVPASVYVTASLTGAFAVGAVITGVMALGKRSDFDAMNGQPDHTLAEIQSAHDSAASLALWNTLLTGGAILAAGATGYFYFTRAPSTDAAGGATRATVLRAADRSTWHAPGECAWCAAREASPAPTPTPTPPRTIVSPWMTATGGGLLVGGAL